MVTCCAFCGADLSYGPPSGVFGRVEDRCPDCGLDAESDVPALVPTDEEMVYDFTEWVPGDRVALRTALVDGDVPFRWEPGPVLAVHENDVVLVEEILDRLDEMGDAAGALAGAVAAGGDEAASEAAYRAMGELFVVADRMARGTWDAQLGAELAELEAVVREAAPPFGVEPRLWDDVRRLADELCTQLDEMADDEEVAVTATGLRDRLKPLV